MPIPFGNFKGFGQNDSDPAEFDALTYFKEKFPEVADQFVDARGEFTMPDDLDDRESLIVTGGAVSTAAAVRAGLAGDGKDRAKAEFMLASLLASLPKHLLLSYVTGVVAASIAMGPGE